MRTLLTLLLLTTPAQAWQFTPGQPCILTHDTGTAQIELTYDPTQPLYSITITRQAPWPDTLAFQMRFDGPQPRVIGTDRHSFSNNNRALTVTDRGFDNLLDGLQFNRTVTAIAGDATLKVPLEGAAAPVAAFRACAPAAATS